MPAVIASSVPSTRPAFPALSASAARSDRPATRARTGHRPGRALAGGLLGIATWLGTLAFAGAAAAQVLPPGVDAALARAKVPREAVTLLVAERLWLLLRRVQGLGIQTIAGDIVLDRQAFETAEADPAAFDGEGLRPYNAGPDALLVNFKSVVATFVPDRGAEVARVSWEPALAGVAMQATVPLAAGECGDWQTALAADLADPSRLRFAGGYIAACGERTWGVAYAEPRTFAARAIAGAWAQMGGQVRGQVRDGRVPAGSKPVFEVASPPLSEVIRDINKYSNNVMAQQLFLTLGLQQKRRGTLEASRAVMRQWWSERIGGDDDAPVFDNGSGLSREERISAGALARMLQVAWRSPVMSELMASLPAAGVDGTLRRRALRSGGSAHLKTGTLRDAAGVAGFVDGASGRRYVVVAIANHANAAAARPAFDALVDWAVQD